MDRQGFAARLKKAVETSRLPDVTAFADRAGIGKTALYTYLSGKRVPDAEVLSEISDAAGVSADWLLTGREPAPPARAGEIPVEVAALAEMIAEAPTPLRRALIHDLGKFSRDWQERLQAAATGGGRSAKSARGGGGDGATEGRDEKWQVVRGARTGAPWHDEAQAVAAVVIRMRLGWRVLCKGEVNG